jgi:outer membrane protein, heavy metal efflux system
MSAITCATVLVLCCSLAAAAPAGAQTPLTLDRALEVLRSGPAAELVRLRVAEAGGLLAGARRLLTENPTLTGAAGPRLAPGQRRTLDARVELLQPLDLPGSRRARVSAAQAAVDAQVASGEAVLRQAEGEVAVAFFRTVAGQQREQVAAAAESGARRAVDALVRRHQLRDVALLDVNVGKTALARATALLRMARAERLAGQAALARLLVIEDAGNLQVRGDLRQQQRFALPALLERARDRPSLRALAAEAREAEAQAALGRAARWPRLALGGSYERDGSDDVLAAILSVELPIFERGQTARATGGARAGRLRMEADAAHRATLASLRGSHAVYQERLSAAAALEEALPLLEQNEELARKSYEAGQLSLAEWIVVRREGLDTRLEHLEQLLAAAEAGVALALAAGVSP